MAEDSLQNKSKLWALVIIDSGLDDSDLTAFEFRVYAHLCRRSDKEHVAWPGLGSIAKTCHFDRRTVIRAMKGLEDKGFIKTTKVVGRGNNYEILPKHCWRDQCPTVTSVPQSPVTKMTLGSDSQSPDQCPTVTTPVTHSHPKVSNEGIQLRYPDKVSSQKKKTDPDRFASEKDLIQFVLSDTHCRSLKACVIDARWFWNAMIQNGWHRDAKGKNPVRDAKATCRVWMGFDSRPTFRDRNSEQHKERWKTDCQLNLPQEELL